MDPWLPGGKEGCAKTGVRGARLANTSPPEKCARPFLTTLPRHNCVPPFMLPPPPTRDIISWSNVMSSVMTSQFLSTGSCFFFKRSEEAASVGSAGRSPPPPP